MNQSFPDNRHFQEFRNPNLVVTTATDEEFLDVARHLRLVRRNIWTIIAVTISCLVAGILVATTATPLYRATSKVMADPLQPNATNNEQFVATALVLLFYETQYEIISSRNVAESVVEKLDLVERFRIEEAERQKNESRAITDAFKNIKTEIKAMFGSVEDSPAAQTDEQLKVMLAQGIQRSLDVSGGTQSQIIDISYSNQDPQLATDIVNSIAETYIQFGLASRLKEVQNTETWLSEQYGQLHTQLRESETRLAEYRSQQGLVDTAQQERIASSQLQTLNTELIRAQTELSAAEEQYLSVQNADEKTLASLGPVLQNNTVRDMIQAQARLLQRVDELGERYGERHPTMIAARAELDSATTNLRVEVNKVVDNIEKNYQLARLQVDNINQLISEQQGRIQNSQDANFTLVALEREVENNRQIYENFQVSLMENNVRGEYSGSNVQIIDSATVPARPFKPNIKMIIAISGVLGLMLGTVLAFIKETLDYTFKTPDTIVDKLGIPALGISPTIRKQTGSVVPQRQYLSDPRSPFSESINTIRTGLLFSNIDSPPKCILVTSATGSEGKTTLAINLAAAYSKLGRTLLLEVDLRKPSIARYLNLKEKRGLTELLSGSINLDDTATSDSPLSIISCGAQPSNPMELLSSNKFSKLLDAMRDRFDYIVLDGPPTLPVSDSCIIANKVDGVIFTVKAEETRIKTAREAIRRLTSLNANVIGAVLTVAEPTRMNYYGDQYYSGEYYGHGEEKARPVAPQTAAS